MSKKLFRFSFPCNKVCWEGYWEQNCYVNVCSFKEDFKIYKLGEMGNIDRLKWYIMNVLINIEYSVHSDFCVLKIFTYKLTHFAPMDRTIEANSINNYPINGLCCHQHSVDFNFTTLRAYTPCQVILCSEYTLGTSWI